jgi:hypothetical protein
VLRSQEQWWRSYEQQQEEEKEQQQQQQVPSDVTKPWGTKLLMREAATSSSSSGNSEGSSSSDNGGGGGIGGGGFYRGSGGFSLLGIAGEQMPSVIEQLAQYGAFIRLLKVRGGGGMGVMIDPEARGSEWDHVDEGPGDWGWGLYWWYGHCKLGCHSGLD